MSEGRREAGILLPLFSVRGQRDWGIGEIADLAPLVRWLAAAGHGLLQLLPIVETSPGERSPYAALSAFAIDSIYLALREVEDFVAVAGGPGRYGSGRSATASRRPWRRPRISSSGTACSTNTCSGSRPSSGTRHDGQPPRWVFA